ncbi:DUF5606 domain-containing protein [uncultured Porphyromonas sp.]|jgi:hypothetical protein|uniref:DUF5606 family protein n=1 Tax=uncultured Porphyromonas sp. TaxID=159274 RepID=UPI002621B650|nr:DUF5606 domain-containing protein [uncultured Porphyromonas sp.]
MLKEILSISGKPGLFKLLTHTKNSIIVEDLETKRRIPAYASDRVVSLGDISIYTTTEETPLREILQTLLDKYEGKPVDLKELNGKEAYFDLFAEVLPEYDRQRVHDNDIKKIFRWYNILVETGYTDFSEPAPEEASETTEEAPAEE